MGKIKLFPVAALLIFLSLFSAMPVCGISIEDFVEPSVAASLRTGAKHTGIQFANSAPNLVPRHEGIRLIIENIRGGLEPNIIAWSLQAYPKPASGFSAVGAEQRGQIRSWPPAEQQALFTAVTALSTLQGLEYYSASRGTMRTFYEISTVIDGPSTKRALPDPVYTYLPSELTLYARQKDLTFGDNVYQYDYRSFPDSLVFVQQNLTSLTAGIITAVGKNRLHSVLAVVDAGDYLLLYAVSMAKASSFPGLKDRIGNSFSNRAEAVMNWVSGQADRVYSEVWFNTR